MANRRFTDCWKRVDRAVEHAKAFTDEWNGLLKAKAREPVIYRKDERTWISRAVIDPIPDTKFAITLGEFTYQLMAALDGVVFEATILQGETDTPTNIEALYFPLAKKLRTFNESAFSNGPLPQDIKYWVESFQPYNAGKAVNPEHEWIISTLVTLHNCARKDRHRRLNVIAAPITSLQYNFDIQGPGKIVDVKFLDADFLTNKLDFIQFGIEGFVDELTTKIQLTTGATVEIRVDEIPVPSGGSLTDEMSNMLKAVDFILSGFEERFE